MSVKPYILAILSCINIDLLLYDSCFHSTSTTSEMQIIIICYMWYALCGKWEPHHRCNMQSPSESLFPLSRSLLFAVNYAECSIKSITKRGKMSPPFSGMNRVLASATSGLYCIIKNQYISQQRGISSLGTM